MKLQIKKTADALKIAAVGSLVLVAIPGWALHHHRGPEKSTASSKDRLVAPHANLPLRFEANRGQSDREVKFLARAGGYTMFLTATEAVVSTQRPIAPLRMKLLGSNPRPFIVGLEELPGESSYFVGNDPIKWRTHIPNFSRVKYRNVYPGIDVIYYGTNQQIEHDFVVAPGVDPSQIRFQVSGADSVELNQGELVIHAADGEVRERKPVIYQGEGDARREIAGGFSLTAGNQISFALGPYDKTKPLVIDPILVYSTYIGGSGTDRAFGPALDRDGNLYVTGETSSANFPSTNPVQPAPGGGLDVFVTKLNANGSAVVYSAYFGGNGDDTGFGIGVDANGNAYVSGKTASTNFPTVNAMQPAYGGGASDAFVLKLNAAGSALLYSTYLGGSGQDEDSDLRLDATGAAYVAGRTSSTNFPTANPVQSANAGGFDSFISKLDPAGKKLVYSTYLGGSGTESATIGLAVDENGNAYVASNTTSTDFPTVNAFQPVYGGGNNDVFVTKLNATGSALVYSTYLGGSGMDAAMAVAVDRSGNAYIGGRTTSTNFPILAPLQSTYGGGAADGFVTKLNAAGTALVYSTYLGGSGIQNEVVNGIAVDAAGNAYVAGITTSLDFPTANPVQTVYGGGTFDAFAAKINAAGSILVYSTYLGGSAEDRGDYVVVDSAGSFYLVGWTASPNFPTRNAVQSANAGGTFDAFIVKLSSDERRTTIDTLSAASFSSSAVAAESLVSAFGTGITGTPKSTTVKVKDSSGTERAATVFFVSATQINFQIPPGTGAGAATITVANNNGAIATGTVQVNRVSPGLFTFNGNGQGVAAALIQRVQPGTPPTYEAVAAFDETQHAYTALPIDLGPETDQVSLILYGTGIRNRSSITAVTAKIGGVDAQVTDAGAQTDLIGLDQVSVRLPRALSGRGEIDVVLTVDGLPANTVRVKIK